MSTVERPVEVPAEPGVVRSAGRVLAYHLTVWRRTWRGMAFSGFVSPLLYLGAMGYGLGSLVDGSTGQGVDGVPYVQFIAPGVLVATAMQHAVGASSYPVLGSIKWSRQYHAMLASPVSSQAVVLGHAVITVLQSLAFAVVFLVVAVPLRAIPSAWGVLSLLAVVLVTAAYTGPMFAVAARAESDVSFTLVFRLVLIPMFLFSGTFFPVSQAPDWLEPLAWVVPLWHGSSLARDATLGTWSGWADVGHVAYLLVWVAAGWVLATRALRRRMVV
ncbi:transport permease protein [Angustibacter aerolatus]|uniref:Transport permease protein n=1 Tax=Angustibacter aerolatus TaxID=1162965 RepID=A0ABQ6JE55_9ACTN|nr:ABC transporter permease [Angustibacter aerolatus]GMA85475.1 transport permease protein [Angustibacter aerolatus]